MTAFLQFYNAHKQQPMILI